MQAKYHQELGALSWWKHCPEIFEQQSLSTAGNILNVTKLNEFNYHQWEQNWCLRERLYQPEKYKTGHLYSSKKMDSANLNLNGNKSLKHKTL